MQRTYLETLLEEGDEAAAVQFPHVLADLFGVIPRALGAAPGLVEQHDGVAAGQFRLPGQLLLQRTPRLGWNWNGNGGE